eukprot:UN02089
MLDQETRTCLEINKLAHSNKKHGSLLYILDNCLTAQGSRLIQEKLNSPSRCINTIERQHDMIEYFTRFTFLCKSVRQELKSYPDVQRCLQKLLLGKGNHIDMLDIAKSIDVVERINDLIGEHLKIESTDTHHNISDLLCYTITEELVELKDFVNECFEEDEGSDYLKSGWDDELDSLRRLRDHGKEVRAELQSKYIEQTQIKQLKIKYQEGLGLFIEIPAAHTPKNGYIGDDFDLLRTQKTCSRFKTQELIDLQERMTRASTE